MTTLSSMDKVTGVVELSYAELRTLIKYTGTVRVVDCDEHDIQVFAGARKELIRTFRELKECA